MEDNVWEYPFGEPEDDEELFCWESGLRCQRRCFGYNAGFGIVKH